MPGKRAVICWIGCILLAATSLTSHAQQQDELPAIFEMIPGDAQIAFVIPDLGRFNQDMAMLNREMELDMPGMGDVLDEFRRTSGMIRGINDQGGMIVAIMNAQNMDQSASPPALMLVPVADYSAFVGNFDGNAQASIAQFNTSWGQSVYCKNAGDFAVLSSQRALVEQYRPGSGRIRMDMIAGSIGDQYVAEGDAVIVIDSTRGAGAVHALVDQWFEWFTTPADDGNGGMAMGELQTRFTSSLKGLLLDGVDALIAQTEVVAIAADVTEDGVGLAAAAKFKPGSQMSQTFSGASDAGNDALSRLPGGPYLTTSSLDLRQVDTASIVQGINQSVQNYSVPWYAAKLDAMAPLIQQARRITKVTYAPSQLSFTTQLFQEVTLIDTEDGRAFAAAFQLYIDSLDGKSIDLGRLPGPNGEINPNASPVSVTLRTQYTSGAQVINGHNVDQYVIEYNFPPQLMAALGKGSGWLMLAVGREQKGYVAPVGQTLVLTNNDDPTLLSNVINALDQTAGLGASQPIRKVRPQLPDDPIYQWYFSAADMARLFNQAVALMDADIEDLEVDEQLTPVAMGVSADETGLAKRVFVPMDVLKAGNQPARVLWELMFPPEPTQSQQAMQEGGQRGPMGPDGGAFPGDPGGFPGDPGGGPGGPGGRRR